MSNFIMSTCPNCGGTGRVQCRSICEVLSTARSSRDLSLRSVEAQTGVSASTISRVENGNPGDWATMVALAKFYELSLDKLATLPIVAPEEDVKTQESPS